MDDMSQTAEESRLDNSAAKPQKKNRSYSVAEKLEMIEYAIQTSNHEAHRKFGVDRKRLIEWRNSEEKLTAAVANGKSSRKKLEGGGRKKKVSFK